MDLPLGKTIGLFVAFVATVGGVVLIAANNNNDDDGPSAGGGGVSVAEFCDNAVAAIESLEDPEAPDALTLFVEAHDPSKLGNPGSSSEGLALTEALIDLRSGQFEGKYDPAGSIYNWMYTLEDNCPEGVIY